MTLLLHECSTLVHGTLWNLPYGVQSWSPGKYWPATLRPATRVYPHNYVLASVTKLALFSNFFSLISSSMFFLTLGNQHSIVRWLDSFLNCTYSPCHFHLLLLGSLREKDCLSMCCVAQVVLELGAFLMFFPPKHWHYVCSCHAWLPWHYISTGLKPSIYQGDLESLILCLCFPSARNSGE